MAETTPMVTMTTAEKLRIWADHMERVPPERMNMGNWCGTTACAAGHACEIPEFREAGLDVLQAGESYPWFCGRRGSGAIAAFFGISSEDAEGICFGYDELYGPNEDDLNESDLTPQDVARAIRKVAERYGEAPCRSA